MPDYSARAGTSGWRATLLAVCFAQATAIVGFDFTLPFIPLYLQHDLGVHGLGQTALWAGLIGFGPAIPATIFGPLWGGVADRFGYRFMLLRAMISAAVLLSLMGFAPSPGVLLGLRMIQGGLTGTVFAAQALVAATVPEQETGRSMGLLQMSVSLGATLGPLGGGIVAEAVGFRAAFVSAGLLLAAAAMIVFLFAREPTRGSTTSHREDQPASVWRLLLLPAFAAALLLTLVAQLSVTALFPLIPLYVQELLHSGQGVATATGWVMALSGIAAAAGSYGAGRLQRRVGLRPLMIAAVLLSTLLLVPQAFVGSYLDFLLLRGVASLAFGALFGSVGIWAALASPAHAKGRAFGLIGAASSMGFGVGPLAGGALAGSLGIRPIFLLSAALLGLVPVTMGLGRLLSLLKIGAQPVRFAAERE